MSSTTATIYVGGGATNLSIPMDSILFQISLKSTYTVPVYTDTIYNPITNNFSAYPVQLSLIASTPTMYSDSIRGNVLNLQNASMSIQNITINTAFTKMAWIYLYTFSGTTDIITSTNNAFTIQNVSGTYYIYYNSTQLSSVSLNTWTHIAIIASITSSATTTLNLYINGIASGSQVTGLPALTTTTATIFFGANAAATSVTDGSFNVDNLRMYNRILSADEVWLIYSSENYTSPSKNNFQGNLYYASVFNRALTSYEIATYNSIINPPNNINALLGYSYLPNNSSLLISISANSIYPSNFINNSGSYLFIDKLASSSLIFNGTNETISFPSQTITWTSDFSILFQFQYNTPSSTMSPLSITSTNLYTTSVGFNISITSGNVIQFNILNPANTSTTICSATLTQNKIYNIAFIYSNSTTTATLYIDGVLTQTTTSITVISSLASGTYPYIYTGGVNSTLNYFNGTIYYLSFYNSTLTTTQISNFYPLTYNNQLTTVSVNTNTDLTTQPFSGYPVLAMTPSGLYPQVINSSLFYPTIDNANTLSYQLVATKSQYYQFQPITLTLSNGLTLLTQFSWTNTNTQTSTLCTFSQSNNLATSNYISLQQTNYSNISLIFNNTSNQYINVATISANTNYTFAATFSNPVSSIYFNGSNILSVPITQVPSYSNIAISYTYPYVGCFPSGSNYPTSYFSGNINYLALYNRILTTTEINNFNNSVLNYTQITPQIPLKTSYFYQAITNAPLYLYYDADTLNSYDGLTNGQYIKTWTNLGSEGGIALNATAAITATSGPSPTIYTTSGLVAYWDFSVTVNGSSNIQDLSGNGCNLYWNSVPQYSSNPYCVNLTTTAQYATSSTSTYGYPNGFTVEALVNYGTLASASLVSYSSLWSLYEVSNQWSMYTNSTMFGQGALQGLGSTIVVNTWYHVCFVVCNGLFQLYLNGVYINTDALVSPAVVGTFYYILGYNSFTGNTVTSTNIAMARIYNTPLTVTQIAQNYYAVYYNLPNNPYNLPTPTINVGSYGPTIQLLQLRSQYNNRYYVQIPPNNYFTIPQMTYNYGANGLTIILVAALQQSQINSRLLDFGVNAGSVNNNLIVSNNTKTPSYVTANLLAYYDFTLTTSGTSIAQNITGNSINNLTWTGTPTYVTSGATSVLMTVGKYLTNTSGNYALNLTGGFTIEFLSNFTLLPNDANYQTTNYPYTFYYGNATYNVIISLGLQGGGGQYNQPYWYCPVGSFVPPPRGPTANVWQHHVITVTSTIAIYYLNGQYIATKTGTASPALANIPLTGNCYLGVNPSTLTQTFNGYLSLFRIYGTAFSQAQVSQNYASAFNNLPGNPYNLYPFPLSSSLASTITTTSSSYIISGLIGYWDFTISTSYSGSGATTVNDLSGNGYNLTFNTPLPTYNSTGAISITTTSTTYASLATTSPAFTLGYTGELVVYLTSYNSNTTWAFSFTSSNSSYAINLLISSTGQVTLGGPAGNSGTIPTSLSLNTWYHIVVTVYQSATNTNGYAIYINGIYQPITAPTGYIIPGSVSMQINGIILGNSAVTGSPTNGLIGKYAMARVYNVALTQAQILQNYYAVYYKLTNNPYQLPTVGNTGTFYSQNNIIASSGSNLDGTMRVYAVRFAQSGTAQLFYNSGTNVGTQLIDSTTYTPLTSPVTYVSNFINKSNSTTDPISSFSLGELLVYRSALSDTSLNAVIATIQNRWNIDSASQSIVNTQTGINFNPKTSLAATTTCALWLDAADMTTIVNYTTSAETISKWIDKSANTYAMTANAYTNAPYYKTNALNNKPGIVFSGAQTLGNASVGSWSFSSSHTIFIVISNTSGGSLMVKGSTGIPATFNAGNRIYYLGDGMHNNSGGFNGLYLEFVGYSQGWFSSQTPITAYGQNSNGFVLCIKYISAYSFAHYVNGIQTQTGTSTLNQVTADGTGQFYIGNSITGASIPVNYLNGTIHEIIAYNTALGDNDRFLVNNYLMNKWGIISTATQQIANNGVLSTSSLYNFPILPFELHNAGIYGSLGPTTSNIQSLYSSQITYTTTASLTGLFPNIPFTLNTNYLQSVNGIQSLIAPVTGMYQFIVAGASGGYVSTANAGKGVIIIGNYYIYQGQTLEVLVGQPGSATYYNALAQGSSGGGGTFVSLNGNLLFAAGGGGGSGWVSTTEVSSPYANATLTPYGNSNIVSTATLGGIGLNSAGGGGGYSGNGTGSNYGYSYVSGGYGGGYNLLTSSASYVTTGLVGYWDFSITTSGSTVPDQSGNNNTLTWTTTPTYTTTGAMCVTGSGSGFSATSAVYTTSYVSTGFSAECLVNLATASPIINPLICLGGGTNSGNCGYANSGSTAGWGWAIQMNSAWYHPTYTPITVGVWYHIVFTVAPNGLTSLYINGSLLWQLSTITFSTASTATNKFYLGYDYNTDSPNCSYGMARYYGIPLTAAQVFQNYNAVYTKLSNNPYNLTLNYGGFGGGGMATVLSQTLTLSGGGGGGYSGGGTSPSGSTGGGGGSYDVNGFNNVATLYTGAIPYNYPLTNNSSYFATLINITAAIAPYNITVSSTANMYVGQAIATTGTTFGSIATSTTYYINSIINYNTVIFATSSTQATLLTVTTATGTMYGTLTPFITGTNVGYNLGAGFVYISMINPSTSPLQTIQSTSQEIFYPLDALNQSSRAAACGVYSLRLLTSGYTGPLLQLRRESDSSILDFYGNYGGVLTSLNGQTIQSWASGTLPYVSKWYDQSGRGNHATQYTSNIQPILNYISGQVDFKVSRYLNLPNGTVPYNASPYTVIIRHNTISTSGTAGLLNSGSQTITTNTGLANTMSSWTMASGAYSDNWAATLTSSAVYSSNNVVSFIYNNNTSPFTRSIYVNGLSAATPLSSSSHASTTASNAIGATGGNYLNGELYNVSIFNISLLDAERNLLERMPYGNILSSYSADPYFNDVTLLLHCDSVNEYTSSTLNANLVDSSVYKQKVTNLNITGNMRANATYNNFIGSGNSIYFDGTPTNYINIINDTAYGTQAVSSSSNVSLLTSLSLTGIGLSNVTVSWTYTSPYISTISASLVVSLNSSGTPASASSTVTTLGASGSSYIFSTLLSGTFYYAVLSATSATYGNSILAAAFTTLALGTLTNLASKSGTLTYNSVTITWSSTGYTSGAGTLLITSGTTGLGGATSVDISQGTTGAALTFTQPNVGYPLVFQVNTANATTYGQLTSSSQLTVTPLAKGSITNLQVNSITSIGATVSWTNTNYPSTTSLTIANSYGPTITTTAQSGTGTANITFTSIGTACYVTITLTNASDATNYGPLPTTQYGPFTVLASFTSFTFTNAGATGTTGPTLSQIQSAYSATSWTQSTAYLNMTTQGIQLWTVQQNGTYQIIAGGGGGGTSGSATAGRGIIVSRSLTLSQGAVISILVGQKGSNSGNLGSGGGGGGTYVVNSGNNPILIAGGGGGGGGSGGGDALISTNGGGVAASPGGTNGYGGAAFGASGGGSGAGFITATTGGPGDNHGTTWGGNGSGGAHSFLNNGIGALTGGFGGGGCGAGGYSGGANDQGIGGGGGSYDGGNSAGSYSATQYIYPITANGGTYTNGYCTGDGFVYIILGTLDGSTAALAAVSASSIISVYAAAGRGVPADGVYWINLPTVGATQIYCIMNTNVGGGGWMMAMKATRGGTFNYDSAYWTTANTLNPTDTTRNDADAKFNTMNYFVGTEMIALWPDIATTGGSLGTNTTNNPFGCWSWRQSYSQCYAGGSTNTPSTMIGFFNSANNIGTDTIGTANGISAYSSFAGWNSTYWSFENQYNYYGFNFTKNTSWRTRWGFAFNENSPNTDYGSNDVGGGIGMAIQSYSAGDYYSCCGSVGLNRSMRVEIYVR